jgi:hypothetical protein
MLDVHRSVTGSGTHSDFFYYCAADHLVKRFYLIVHMIRRRWTRTLSPVVIGGSCELLLAVRRDCYHFQVLSRLGRVYCRWRLTSSAVTTTTNIVVATPPRESNMLKLRTFQYHLYCTIFISFTVGIGSQAVSPAVESNAPERN